MTDSTPAPLHDLLEDITTWPVGMPVRVMERVLAAGAHAVPVVTEALERWEGAEERDPLWLIVLLGELRSAAAIGPLLRQMRPADLDLHVIAASEALAKIGPPAIPALAELSGCPDPFQRLYAYAALGWIADDRAYRSLIEALGREREVVDVVALALGDQGHSGAIPHLYAAYLTCDPWQRPGIEEAIQDLKWQRRTPALLEQDWRLRYRRLPWLEGSFAIAWPTVSAIRYRHLDDAATAHWPPCRSLDAITADPPAPADPDEVCKDCGARIEYPTGLPVCPESAVAMTMWQLALLGWAREQGFDDVFEVYDHLDDLPEMEDVVPELRRGDGPEKSEEAVATLGIFRETCRWLIEQGLEHVGPAEARLLKESEELAERYGDPQGMLWAPEEPARQREKVGRNEPCPCGSGKKFKRCCAGKEGR